MAERFENPEWAGYANNQGLLDQSMSAHKVNVQRTLDKEGSEKERKLLSLKMAEFNVPEFRVLDSSRVWDIQIVRSMLETMNTSDRMGKLIVRSSHLLEGNNWLPWIGMFESIPNVSRNPQEIQRAYQVILSHDFRALRYAKKHWVADFSMSDMGVIVMPPYSVG